MAFNNAVSLVTTSYVSCTAVQLAAGSWISKSITPWAKKASLLGRRHEMAGRAECVTGIHFSKGGSSEKVFKRPPCNTAVQLANLVKKNAAPPKTETHQDSQTMIDYQPQACHPRAVPKTAVTSRVTNDRRFDLMKLLHPSGPLKKP